MQTISTIGAWIDGRYTVTVHCGDPDCRHQAALDLPALAARLGVDFETVGDPNPLTAKLRCSQCQGKDLSLIISPPTSPATGAGHSLSTTW